MQSSFSQLFPRFIVTMVVSVVLAGCNQIQTRSFVSDAAPRSDEFASMSPELKQFLDDSVEHASALFDRTPWGEQAEITILYRYFSGSGRDCLSLEVAPSVSQAMPVTLCDRNGQWYSVRPVTRLLNAQ